ncbi:unnamed protein product [Urochloa decumbens]|uniref:Uncharacterized protein n=1 Tax=Urochloa decumbens TaxID=240449 RepID=A0ABC8WHZ1_9POAL
MGSGDERRAMENGGESMRRFPSEIVMCSTCSGFVMRRHTTMDPYEEVVEVVTEAEKMRKFRAVCRYGLLQLVEPAEATMEQWRVLRRRRLTEGSGSKKAETEDTESREEVKMEVSESAGGNGKTKMVTRRMYKESIDVLLNLHPLVKPFTFTTSDPLMRGMFARRNAEYEVDCEFQQYLRIQSVLKGYAEYQLEVTDDEDE